MNFWNFERFVNIKEKELDTCLLKQNKVLSITLHKTNGLNGLQMKCSEKNDNYGSKTALQYRPKISK